MTFKTWFAWAPLCLVGMIGGGLCDNAHAWEPVCRYVNIVSEPLLIDRNGIYTNGALNGSETSVLLNTGWWANILTIESALGTGVVTEADALERRRKLGAQNPEYFGPDGKSAMFLTKSNDTSIGKMHVPDAYSLVLFNSKDSGVYPVQVGGQVLFSHDLELSLQDKRLKFFEPTDCRDAFLAYWSEQASVTNMRKVSGQYQHLRFDVEINGYPMHATISTMDKYSTISEEAAARAKVTKPSSAAQTVIEEPEIHSGRDKRHIRMWQGTFESFKMGDEVIAHPRITVVNSSAIEAAETLGQENALINSSPDVVLGLDFLLSHRVLFAFSQNKLYFSYVGGRVFDDSQWQKIDQLLPKPPLATPQAATNP